MAIEIICDVLAWCAVINIGLLLLYGLVFLLAHDLIYRIHGKGFELSVERFDAIHYKNMAFYKACIFLFNIVPYLALRIVG